MNEMIPFLKTILDDPLAEFPRLLFADWLEERGDPRAEKMRAGMPPLFHLMKNNDGRFITRLQVLSNEPIGSTNPFCLTIGNPKSRLHCQFFDPSHFNSDLLPAGNVGGIRLSLGTFLILDPHPQFSFRLRYAVDGTPVEASYPWPQTFHEWLVDLFGSQFVFRGIDHPDREIVENVEDGVDADGEPVSP